MSEFLSQAEAVATQAAREAGKLALKYFRHDIAVEVKEGNPRNVVTAADKEADSLIRKLLQEKFPDHSIVTEEDKPKKGSEYVWYVDPIDGTTNFSRGASYFCTSIALAKESELLVGVVYSPVFSELYTAIRGKGAFLNGKRIRVSGTANLSQAVFSCDLGYNSPERESTLKVLRHLEPIVRGFRMKGSGALASCELAAGRADCHMDAKSTPWDYAAAALIVREAGGKATDLQGNEWKPDSKAGYIAGNARFHGKLIDELRAALK